ncbi:MAG: GNAT family N-acetyltransferase [Halobacteria archaeon]|nr:GNAT family N-acetyltransferase [Halobacteria archaeon]
MDHEVLGWPEDSPVLELDHELFSYAGKFVMTNTGKAVAKDSGEIVGAVAFNEDRTSSDVIWIRYITVRKDRRGEGIGPELAVSVTQEALEVGYEKVRIAVNNPFAYHALYKSGFGYTGETTGIAELVLEYPREGTKERYQEGLKAFKDRKDLSDEELEFLDEKRGKEDPSTTSNRLERF